MPFRNLTLRKIPPILLILTFAVVLSGCKAVGNANSAALQVTSNPQASVFLDDKHIGKTPFFSDQLKEGEHSLKITAGEATYVDKIGLKNGALTVVNRDLNNNFSAQSGETLWLVDGENGFFVASSPPDADITIDGQYKGKTPSIIDFESGEHKVKIGKSGYTEREFTIKTAKNYKVIANVTLSSKEAKNPQQKNEQNTIDKVEILETPQGFLRVRKEPQLDAQELGQVSTGTTYEVIQETDDWIKISFDGKQGWVSKQYTKKI